MNERLIDMTNREMFEQIQDNAPHMNAIRYALNELEAAALTARDVYNCTNESEYNSDAEECEKIAAALTALYNNITSRESANLQASSAEKCHFAGDKPEDIWATKRFEDGE